MLRKLKAYLSLTRNVLLSLVKYRSLQAAGNGFSALFSQFGSDIRNLFSRTPRVRCNICGWTGAVFCPSRGIGVSKKGIICPVCDSFPRQRYLRYYLEEKLMLNSPAKVLHFAPEPRVAAFLRDIYGPGYLSLDLVPDRKPAVLSDIRRLGLKTGSFDLVICFEVLEHVDDDAQAMAEILRILKPARFALITVPQNMELMTTVERDRPDPLDSYHVRVYGMDFTGCLEEAGFDVSAMTSDEVVDEDAWRELRLGGVVIYRAGRLA